MNKVNAIRDKTDIGNLLTLIDEALVEADNYVRQYYAGDEALMSGTKEALQLLKEEVQHHPDNINESVLKAIRIISAVSVKNYDPSALANAISKINSILYYGIPGYKNLII